MLNYLDRKQERVRHLEAKAKTSTIAIGSKRQDRMLALTPKMRMNQMMGISRGQEKMMRVYLIKMLIQMKTEIKMVKEDKIKRNWREPN